jgi:hypothetical protein
VPVFRLLDNGRSTVVAIESQYGVHVWKRATTRKAHTCAMCGAAIALGEVCYLPQTNRQSVKRYRVCAVCVQGGEKQ